jgi:hypothetical protein
VYSAARPAEPIYSEGQRRNDERRNRIIAYDAYPSGSCLQPETFLAAKPTKGRNSASGLLPGNGTRPSGHCDPKTERQCKRETVEECARILARARVESTTNVKGPCRYAFNASFTRQTVDTPLPVIFAALWIECPPSTTALWLTIPKWIATRHRMPFPMRPWGSGCSSAPGR